MTKTKKGRKQGVLNLLNSTIAFLIIWGVSVLAGVGTYMLQVAKGFTPYSSFIWGCSVSGAIGAFFMLILAQRILDGNLFVKEED
jgi:hypothetical protein